MVCNHLKLRYARFFLEFTHTQFLLLRLLWQMNSHNSAIASRTDVPRVASRTVTMQRCRNWAVVLYPFAYSSNASLPNLCMIFFGKPEVAVSQSLIIFAVCTKGFTCRLLAAFPCSLVAMLCLPIEILLSAYHTCLYEFSFKVNLFGFKYHYGMVLQG